MGRKQIREVTIVDEMTGELLSRKAMYSSKFSESFIMVRTTDSLDWYFALNGNECKLILLLHQWAESSNGRISIAGWHKEFIFEKLGIKSGMLGSLVRGLIEKDCMIKIGSNDFMVNPAHVFKCSTSEVREKMREYEFIKTKLK